jgi:2-oxo-4-hydroxy-4-carboxy-5-ureidoimidazoline decarboxylase
LSSVDLAEFNQAEAEHVRALLRSCLDVPRWVDAVLAGRPYAGIDALLTAGRAAMPLSPEEVHQAMAAHPRIGERASGRSSSADWSRSEQSDVEGSTAERFAEANAEYEHRFRHLYLVCANGRGGDELLEDLRSRLGNDPPTELEVAGRELAKIADLRLTKAVHA